MKKRILTTEIKEEILNKFFTFDGKVATLKLVYDTFAELINPNFGDEKTEKLNDKLFADIQEAVAILPKTYKLNVHVVIRDFGTYSRAECETILWQNVRLAMYLALKSAGGHRLGGLALIGVGAVVLLASYFLHTGGGVFFDIINIGGTLFVWEGVNTAFLQPQLELNAARKLAKALQSITVEAD